MPAHAGPPGAGTHAERRQGQARRPRGLARLAAFDRLPDAVGQLSLDLENGQILSVEPGAARLLGVLSLQGLLRFATLDFRTLSGRGLVFDRIAGTGTIESGVGTIQEFELRSPQILASMSGTANLLRETQDLRVDVVPRINATSTSIAAAFINPVLGIGTLAAQLLFADEFSKVFTQHYRITGSWANPQIGKLEDNKAQAPTFQNRATPPSRAEENTPAPPMTAPAAPAPFRVAAVQTVTGTSLDANLPLRRRADRRGRSRRRRAGAAARVLLHDGPLRIGQGGRARA